MKKKLAIFEVIAVLVIVFIIVKGWNYWDKTNKISEKPSKAATIPVLISEPSPAMIFELSPTPIPTIVISETKESEELEPTPYFISDVSPYIFKQRWGYEGYEPGEFKNPQSIIIDSGDHIYVADTNNNRIQKFDTDGNFINSWKTMASIDGEMPPPKGVAVDKDGNVYVAVYGDSEGIQKFTSDGVFIDKLGVNNNENLRLLTDISTNSSGDIYVSSYSYENPCYYNEAISYIVVFVKRGAFDEKHIISNEYYTEWNKINRITGIGIDSSDYFYLLKCEFGLGKGDWRDSENHFYQSFLLKFEPSNKYKPFRKLEKPNENKENYSSGIAIDKKGYIYVGNTSDDCIQMISPEGNIIAEWGKEGIGDSQFKYPVDIALDSEENLYVLDRENNCIQKFTRNSDFPFE